MTRIRKDPEIRQTELMDAAFELFCSVGYEKTVVRDIVKKAGVAKGTFFYYFPTKEAVLEAICTREALKMVSLFKLQTRQLTALNKLQSFIFQIAAPSPVDNLIDILLNENQFNFVFSIWKQHIENIFNPILIDIIIQGNQEKTMNVICLKETTDFFWSTLDCLLEAGYYEESPTTLTNKSKIAELIITKILGIEENRLDLSIFKN